MKRRKERRDHASQHRKFLLGTASDRIDRTLLGGTSWQAKQGSHGSPLLEILFLVSYTGPQQKLPCHIQRNRFLDEDMGWKDGLCFGRTLRCPVPIDPCRQIVDKLVCDVVEQAQTAT